MNWFYSPDGSERFEVSEVVLAQLIRDGKVLRGTLVWRDGLADWMTAEAVNPGWFGPPRVEALPPVGLPPPVELPPPSAVVPPDPTTAEVSPWSHPRPEPEASLTPPAPPDDSTPPPVEITVPPPPPPPSVLPSLSPPAPPAPGFFPPTMPSQPRDSAALSSVISGGIALVGSMSGICCCFGPLIAMVAGVTAVVFGHMAYNQAKNHPEAERDKGLATVGIVLGYLAIAISIGTLLFGLLVGGLSAVTENFHLP